MRKSETLIWIFTFILSTEIIYSQNGWTQTQLNGSIGYSLTLTGNEIFASTGNGAFSTSENGMPWFSKSVSGIAVYDIIKRGQYILAATDSGILRTSDNGASWQMTYGSPPLSGSGGTIGSHKFAKNSSQVFVIAWARGIFRSGDDGLNWEQVYAGKDGAGYQDYAAAATCIGSIGERIIFGRSWDQPYPIYYSDDNGNTWSGSNITRSDGRSDQFLFFYNDNGNLFAGGFMGLYLSTNSGNSWSAQYMDIVGPQGEMIGLGIFRDLVSYNNYLVAAVDFNSLQISGDYGKSWKSFNEGLTPDWTFGAVTIKPPNIWALRQSFGNAYRRDLTEVITDVETGAPALPDIFSLSQNYPNPFNPSTTIKYSVPGSQFVTLKVFDPLGRESAILVNEYKYPGNYEVKFETGSLSAGVYFYRLQSGSFSKVKKLVIMK